MKEEGGGKEGGAMKEKKTKLAGYLDIQSLAARARG